MRIKKKDIVETFVCNVEMSQDIMSILRVGYSLVHKGIQY